MNKELNEKMKQLQLFMINANLGFKTKPNALNTGRIRLF